jgi:rapamycin-insensitive companion of mTOR
MSFMQVRPSIEALGRSLPGAAAGQGLGLEDEVIRQEDEGETVESVMNKLAIERRVQYGAEKMLDVGSLPCY